MFNVSLFVIVAAFIAVNSPVNGDELAQLRAENEQVKSQLRSLEREVMQIKKQQVIEGERTTSLEEKLNALRKKRIENSVAFSVTSTETKAYAANAVIEFPNAITNINPGFPGWNPATNQFACPVQGLYLFTVTLYKDDGVSANYNLVARLKMTGADLAELDNWREGTTFMWSSSSISAIVECGPGQNVWVGAQSAGTLSDCAGCGRNQFSGVLLTAPDDDLY